MNEQAVGTKPKPAFYVRNVGGPVRQMDSKGLEFDLHREAWTPIYDEALRVRYMRFPEYYEVSDVMLPMGAPTPPDIPVDMLSGDNPAIGYVEVIKLPGESEPLVPEAIHVKLGDGRVLGLDAVLNVLTQEGHVRATKAGKITLFPKTDKELVFGSLGDFVKALQESEGILMPPAAAAAEGDGED